MATPSREPVRGVQVVGGISVQGDFVTQQTSVTQPGFREVTLKCGKGFPLIQLPRIQWTKPPREESKFPSLETLKQDIQSIFSTVSDDINKSVSSAKDSISASWKTYLDQSVGKIQEGYKHLFEYDIQVVFYKHRVFQNDESVGSYVGKGAIPFRFGAYNAARNIYINHVNANWWKILLGYYELNIPGVGKVPMILPGGQMIETYEWYISVNDWRTTIDEKFNQSFQSGMSAIKDGIMGLVTKLPSVLLDIAGQIGAVVKTIINSIVSAFSKIAEKLSEYARQLVQAAIGMVKNAVNEILEKTVYTLNEMLVKIETGYNNIIQKFNTTVVEPIQCKLKEIEDKLKQMDWIFKIKLPSFPRLPGFGEGGGAYSLPQWFSALSTTLTAIDNKLSNLTVRVSILENKLSAK